MILLSWAICCFVLKKIGLLSQATFPHTLIGLFSRATCPHSHIGLFSGAIGPHTHTVYFHGRPALKLTVVYFHGRPTHTCSSWSIFRGDRPTNVHPGLSSWATCPSTHTDLFSRATYPHMLILVYFQGRPAHMVYFHGRPALPLTLIYFHGRPTHTCSS